MRSFESWALGYLLNSLWQVPLLSLAAWIAARALRSTGAVVEHRVWVSALLLQSLLPACAMQPWLWLHGLSLWNRVSRASEAHVAVVIGPGTASGSLHLPAGLLAVIAIAYGIAVLYFAARLLWRGWRIFLIRQEARHVVLTDEAALCWARCCRRFGVYNAVLAVSTEVFGPVTIGLTRKLVLLPTSMVTSLLEGDLQTVIAHEFAHMRRQDFTKNLLYELISLPIMYHPLFWLTRSRVVESREVVCDEMAAEAGAGREKYARSLLRLASMLVQGTSVKIPNAIGIFDANAFERRIMKLTQGQKQIRGVRRIAILVGCITFGLGTCVSALALRLDVYAPSAGSEAIAATKKDAPVTVSSAVMAGNVLTRVNPTYPEAAKKAKIQGAVVLHAIIGTDGTIENLRVVSGPEELLRSSLVAVRQWTYKPYLLNGNPVEVDTTITVTYSFEP